jgi:hypothetical protein
MNQDEVDVQYKHLIASICGLIAGFLALSMVGLGILFAESLFDESLGNWLGMYLFFVGAAVLIGVYVISCSSVLLHKILAVSGVGISLLPILIVMAATFTY